LRDGIDPNPRRFPIDPERCPAADETCRADDISVDLRNVRR